MPFEKRDEVSGAKLFIPTASERAIRESQRQLNQELEDVAKLKKELQQIIAQAKEQE